MPSLPTIVKYLVKKPYHFLLKYEQDCGLLKFRGPWVDRQHSIYEWNFSGKKVYGTADHFLSFMDEYLAGKFTNFYGRNFKGKTVLDVGGFAGDTAMHFLEHGASRVIIYEPLEQNIAAAKLNLKQYEGRYEIHKGFVCDSAESKVVSSSGKPGTGSFGLPGTKHTTHVNCIHVRDVLQQGIDYAKFDCEGCEYYLAGVGDELLKRIPEWSIEFHLEGSMERYVNTLNKFYSCGFILTKMVRVGQQAYLADFRKAPQNPVK